MNRKLRDAYAEMLFEDLKVGERENRETKERARAGQDVGPFLRRQSSAVRPHFTLFFPVLFAWMYLCMHMFLGVSGLSLGGTPL